MNELQRICHLCPRSALCAVEGAWQSQLDNESAYFGFRRIICHPWSSTEDRMSGTVVFYLSPEQQLASSEEVLDAVSKSLL